jgi:hypothetical protein
MPRLRFRRSRSTSTDVAQLRRWPAIGAPVAVVMITSLLGPRRRRFLATAQHPSGNEWILGRHRTREAAKRTCERYVRLANLAATSAGQAARSKVCSGQQSLFGKE